MNLPWKGQEGVVVDADLKKNYEDNRVHILAEHVQSNESVYNFLTNYLKDGVDKIIPKAGKLTKN